MKTGFRSRVLTRVLNGLGVSVMAFLLVASSIGAQQGGTVTGRVLDSDTGQPLAAVQVFISALDLGGLTQQNGRYLLQNVPAGSHMISAARIGYRSADAQTSVGGGQTVEQNFLMTEEALALDEIIVTGTPGGTQRRAIGNTVATVAVGDLVSDIAVASFQDLLAGRTPGLQFVTQTGNVGAGSGITIRGITSFDTSRNRPLIYVDGVRVNNADNLGPTIGEQTGGRGQAMSMDDFNPEDIESIEIIKGPAAASLYGTEASAGVIQIITKRGAQGAPEFNVSVRGGTNYMRDPSYRMGTMWTCPTDFSPGPVDCQTEESLRKYNMYDEGTRYIKEGYFDWPTPNLYSNGLAQSYNVDVRGGTDAIRYFVSTGFDDREGMVKFNTDQTFRLRGNIGVVFDEHFSLDVSTGYVEGKTRFMNATKGDGGIWADLLWSNGHPLDRLNPFGSVGSNARLGGFQEHLPTDVSDIEATRQYSRFTGSATLNFQSGDYSFGALDATLTQRLVVGLDKSWDVNSSLYPLEAGPVPGQGGACVYCRAPQQDLSQYLNNWKAVYSETLTGEMELTRPIQTNTSFDYAITQNLDLNGVWGFATSVGAQFYTDKNERFGNHGNGFASPLSRTINQLSQSQIVTRFHSIENKSLGFYVQQELSWNDRVFVTGAMRFDDNSTFGVDATALKYPKLSGTWVISEESFWNIDAVNSFRLRGAWGKAGRQPSATAGMNIYAANTGPAGQPAIRASSPGNPAIRPETSTETELGFDFALFDDRLSGEFTNYSRMDKDALRPIALAPSFGFPGSVDRNVGRIKSWGWEAILSARLYESDAISIDVDFATDYTANQIKNLGDYAGISSSLATGLSYPNVVHGDLVVDAQFVEGGKFANAFNKQLDAQCDLGVSLAPTGTSDVDQTQWGRVPGGPTVDCWSNQNRRISVGQTFPEHTYSVAPRISLFNNQFQINALAEGRYGRLADDDGHAWGHSYNNSKDSRLLNDAIYTASRVLNGNGASFVRSTYNGDFWTMREIGARYTLPEALTGRIGASRASVNVSGRNLFLIWRAQTTIQGQRISDPEYGDGTNLDGDGNFYSLPPLSSINITMRITF
jgi:TonB-linked SusC/RagA family outer membrane protein